MNFSIGIHNPFLVNNDAGKPITNEDGVLIRKIHVKRFQSTITQSELQSMFSKFGAIDDCRLVYIDGSPIYAFITFKDCESARKAMYTNVYHHRRKMVVSPADTWHQPQDCKVNKTKDKANKNGESIGDKKTSVEKTEVKKEPIVGSSSQEEPSCSADSDYTILDILNHDCIMKIFSYLTVKDLIYSERVSKRWRELVNEKLQGLRVFKTSRWAHEKSPLTTNTFRTLLIKFGSSLRKLHLDCEWTMLNQRTPQIISKFCPNITDLLISRISSKNWGSLLENCCNLKHLSLLSCDDILDRHFSKMKCKLEGLTLTSTTMLSGEFLKYLDGEVLKELALNKCFGLRGDMLMRNLARFKNLGKLSLDSSRGHVTTMCDKITALVPQLTEFSLSNIDATYGKQVNLNMIEQFKNLEVLFLSKNCTVNDDILKAISKSCLKLTTLDISVKRSFRSDVTNDGINHLWKLPNLQVLGLGNAGIGDTAFDRIGTYGSGSKLKTLVCRRNVGVTNSGLLKVVQMCPDITKIDAYGCPEVNEEFIKAANDAIMLHPNRTEKLMLYIAHVGLYIEKTQEVIKNLNCPLVQVEIQEQLCDALLHSYYLCNRHFTSDTDDDDDDDENDDDDYDNYSDLYEYSWDEDVDSLDGDLFAFNNVPDFLFEAFLLNR